MDTLERLANAGAGRDGLRDDAPWRVLLVDGDPRAQAFATGVLRLDGHEVRGYDGAEAALREAHRSAPDVVVLDLDLPGLTGFEAAEALRRGRRTCHVPILVASSHGDPRSRAAAFASGADCFLDKPFTADELSAAVGSLGARARGLDDVEPGVAVVEALAEVVMLMWGDARPHVRKSSWLARRFGTALGLPNQDTLALERAGWLHDIGKVGVPAAILNKPGSLTAEERRVMQRHPVLGAQICQGLATLEPVLPVILHHHEWWDGSGYPDGLAGEEIPFLARVFQVADVYEALVARRCYKAALAPAEALAVIRAEADAGKWDPRLVARFVEFSEAGLLDP